MHTSLPRMKRGIPPEFHVLEQGRAEKGPIFSVYYVCNLTLGANGEFSTLAVSGMASTSAGVQNDFTRL